MPFYPGYYSILGICVGMQLMADQALRWSADGLGWIPGMLGKS